MREEAWESEGEGDPRADDAPDGFIVRFIARTVRVAVVVLLLPAAALVVVCYAVAVAVSWGWQRANAALSWGRERLDLANGRAECPVADEFGTTTA